jgi:hypothetical protein
MEVPAIDLLSTTRLDVVARIPLARALISGRGLAWGVCVYSEYLKAMTKGHYDEGGKSSLADYVREYCQLVNSIQMQGFDTKLGTVPTVDGKIVNGAHRLATCISLNISITCSEGIGSPERQDYDSLQKNGLPDFILQYLVLEYIRLKKSTRALVLLDSSPETLRSVIAEFPHRDMIICVREIKLTEIGKRRIIDLMYSHNDWWSIEFLERFVAERFESKNDTCFVIYFDAFPISNLQSFKESLREKLPQSEFNRKLHGTDFHYDTILLAQTTLNDNGIFFLNNSPIGSESRISSLFEGAQNSEHVMVGSAPLELFGLRDARDIDFALDESEMFNGVSLSETEGLTGYGLNPESLTQDPRLFVRYKNLKFAALSTTIYYKSKRLEAKDKEDVALIARFLQSDRAVYFSSQVKSAAFVMEKSRRRDFLRNRISSKVPVSVKSIVRKILAKAP